MHPPAGSRDTDLEFGNGWSAGNLAAGGSVTDWQGRPLRAGDAFAQSGGRMIASGDRRIHDQALEILTQA